MAVYPFIPLDAAKALVCTFAILPMRRRIGTSLKLDTKTR
jgi:hypothetical protein